MRTKKEIVNDIVERYNEINSLGEQASTLFGEVQDQIKDTVFVTRKSGEVQEVLVRDLLDEIRVLGKECEAYHTFQQKYPNYCKMNDTRDEKIEAVHSIIKTELGMNPNIMDFGSFIKLIQYMLDAQ